MTKKIYIIISASDTIPARLIRRATRAEYNHSSICFDDEFKTFYSFGRKVLWNPFYGGFVNAAQFGVKFRLLGTFFEKSIDFFEKIWY